MEFILLLIFIVIAAYLLLRRKTAGVQQVPTGHLPEIFIVLDLETTGLDATRDEIIEIAAIRYRKGTTTQETLQALVKPSKKVPKKITEITGITQEMLDTKGEPLANVMREFMAFVGERRLVMFNAEFDMAFFMPPRPDTVSLSSTIRCPARLRWLGVRGPREERSVSGISPPTASLLVAQPIARLKTRAAP